MWGGLIMIKSDLREIWADLGCLGRDLACVDRLAVSQGGLRDMCPIGSRLLKCWKSGGYLGHDLR